MSYHQFLGYHTSPGTMRLRAELMDDGSGYCIVSRTDSQIVERGFPDYHTALARLVWVMDEIRDAQAKA